MSGAPGARLLLRRSAQLRPLEEVRQRQQPLLPRDVPQLGRHEGADDERWAGTHSVTWTRSRC